jgi:hypothetical protein
MQKGVVGAQVTVPLFRDNVALTSDESQSVSTELTAVGSVKKRKVQSGTLEGYVHCGCGMTKEQMQVANSYFHSSFDAHC